MTLLGLLTIPLLVAAVAAWKFPKSVTWKEFLLQLAIQTPIIVGGYYIARYQSLSDTELLNGRITGKEFGSQKCCHCRMVCIGYHEVCSGTGKDRSCSMQCSGYREECDHFQDYYWSLESTLGDIPVESCEPHSSQVPLAWASAYVGEPATVSHTYTNYLKADRESLFVHKELEHFKVPELPEVYGYYRANPVLGDAAVPGEWQTALREINADLGASHQVDVKVLTTRVQDPTYAQAVEARWLYGPKNSVTIVLGIEGTKITWARVVTFSKVENLKVFLRDELQGKTFEDDVPLIIRRAVSQMFRRTAMSDYEYLARAAQPSTGWLVFLYVLGTAISVGIAVYMHKHDVFGEESLQFGYSYRQNHYRRK